jgi:acyl-coenzyme A synthetase/AMP-(fatty) acid ligase
VRSLPEIFNAVDFFVDRHLTEGRGGRPAFRIDAERAFATIAAERPMVFFAAPTLYARMLEVPVAEHRFDLSSLRLAVSGEATCSGRTPTATSTSRVGPTTC